MDMIISILYAAADLGFSRGGGATRKGGGANLLFCPIFPKNCMKMKRIRPRGGAPGTPLDPPMDSFKHTSTLPKTKLSGLKSCPNGPDLTESMVPGSRSINTARGTYFPPVNFQEK